MFSFSAAPTLSRNVMPVINAEVKRQGGKGGPNILYLYCDFTPDPGTKYYYTVGWHLSNGISFTRFLWSSPTTEYTNQNHFRRKTAFDEKKMKQVGVLHLGFKVC